MSQPAAAERPSSVGSHWLVPEEIAALRPVTAVIRVVQDRARTGADLLRTLDYIPEIVTAEVLDEDGSLLLRIQATEPARIEAIASGLCRQSAVVSLDVTRTTVVLSKPPANGEPVGEKIAAPRPPST
ncbi:hypothetical protein [Sinomonas mesophila]|uniref:hypothetical protein n=1 Tax=Sinomonas mesophila TaxID=1531955 RepID=UPI00111599E2|nr:hypothetical protein [Sinomonas mesophila]